MDDSYCLLPERISEQFSEIDSDIVMETFCQQSIITKGINNGESIRNRRHKHRKHCCYANNAFTLCR